MEGMGRKEVVEMGLVCKKNIFFVFVLLNKKEENVVNTVKKLKKLKFKHHLNEIW